MPTVSEIKTAIKAGIDSVSDVGTVFKSRVLALDDAGGLHVLMAFENSVDEHTLRGWQMMVAGMERSSLSDKSDLVRYVWELHSFQTAREKATIASPDEDDEIAFDLRNELVVQAFRTSAYSNLGGVVMSTTFGDGSEAGLQLRDHDLVAYGGGPCYMAVYTLNTIHTETV